MRRVEKSRAIRLAQVQVPVTVYFEARRAARASIGSRGVHIRIPAWLSASEREAQIRHLRGWAEKTLKKNPDRFLPRPARSYHQGEALNIGGRVFRLDIRHGGGKRGGARIEDDLLRVQLPAGLSPREEAGEISRLIARAAGREFLPELRDTLERLNDEHFRAALGKVAFRDNRVLWGSCSGRGNISIAVRLLLAPRNVLEYVCVHELAHLVERGHTRRFWDQVSRAMPAWKEARRWLREHRDSCRF
jgi:predicted metal-dependent hydrolase